MKTSSAKSKGRRLQQWVRCLLIKTFDLEEDDVLSTSMGAGGEDVKQSPKARGLTKHSFECKNQERVNVWKAYEQAEANAGDYEPCVIIKKNRHKPLAVVDAEHFIGLLNEK